MRPSLPSEGSKTRMICFRVSESDYQALKRLYRVYGARTVSEFARVAIESMVGRVSQQSPIETRLDELGLRLAALDAEVNRLGTLISAPKASVPPASSAT